MRRSGKSGPVFAMPPSALFFSLAVVSSIPCMWLCMQADLVVPTLWSAGTPDLQGPDLPIALDDHLYLYVQYILSTGALWPPARAPQTDSSSAEADYETLRCNTQCGRHSLAASTCSAHCRGIIFRPTEQPQILRSFSGMWSTPACGIKERKAKGHSPFKSLSKERNPESLYYALDFIYSYSMIQCLVHL